LCGCLALSGACDGDADGDSDIDTDADAGNEYDVEADAHMLALGLALSLARYALIGPTVGFFSLILMVYLYSSVSMCTSNKRTLALLSG